MHYNVILFAYVYDKDWTTM